LIGSGAVTAHDAWFASAKAVPIERELDRRGVTLKRQGQERVGPCPRCGGKDRFSTNVNKNIWNCRGCAKGGDVIALVQHLDGTDFLGACETLTGEKRPNGGNGRAVEMPDGEALRALAEQQEQHAGEREQREEQERQERAKQRDKARYLWRVSQPAGGTIVETYLRSRGISMPIPATIRYLPPRTPEHQPAMITVYGIPAEPEPGFLAIDETVITAVHLTLLKPDGSSKADADPNKLTIGSPAGRPLVVAPMNDLMGLAICEGIEDALSVHQATALGAWAAGSASYMPKLVAAIKHLAGREEDTSPDCITVLADADQAGRRNGCALRNALLGLSKKLAAISSLPEHFEVLVKELAT
jgi:phage/plasmid primase-like uncharacterized protein